METVTETVAATKTSQKSKTAVPGEMASCCYGDELADPSFLFLVAHTNISTTNTAKNNNRTLARTVVATMRWCGDT